MKKEAPHAEVSQRVCEFYEQLPFNFYCTAVEAANRVTENPIRSYPDLDALLCDNEVNNVLEIGCGAGWAANSIALHYSKRVTAIDMTAKALERAKDVSERLGTEDRVKFVHADLFTYQKPESFDLVLSIGVLHHTFDCRQAFGRVSGFVASAGFMFVGLYHRYGRIPFLNLFREVVEKEGEDAAFQRYAKLSRNRTDDVHLRSWFRDQVLHPQETQHTLAEIIDWLDEFGFELISTSINHYGNVSDRESLIDLEVSYEALSERRNRIEGSYFPGFFTILAKRKSD